MIREAIDKLVRKTDLSETEMGAAFDEIMSGQATPSQIGAFLAALRMKGETISEITAAAKVMREKCVRIRVLGELLDTCGTGGSGIDTFNVSTTVAFVAAASGLKVAKHGNRSASGHCGSADVLEELGARLDLSAEETAGSIEKVGIGFLFAPAFHQAMRHAAVPRREIGVRTIFNILGPLSNPAHARRQLLGVYSERLTEVMAEVLKNLGSERVLVVHGMDGLDEITIAERTKVSELKAGKVETYFVAPEDFGLKRARLDDIKGAGAKENARIVLSVLTGEKGPRRDIVLFNAAAALIAGSRAKGFREGMALAAGYIDSGRALEKLNDFVEFTKKKR